MYENMRATFSQDTSMTHPPSPSSHKNLLMIGDCNTFPDHLLPMDEQLAVQVQKNLSKAVDTPIQITNIGQGMYTTREGLARLKDTPVIPDYVAINFGLVDAWETSVPFLYIPYYPLTAWRKYPLKWLKMFKKKLRYLKAIVPRGPVVPVAEYEKNIIAMIDLCCARNPNSAIVLWGTAYTQDKLARNDAIDRYNAVLEKIAHEKECAFCPTTRLINHDNNKNYLDKVHLSHKATTKLGQAIVQYMIKK